MKKIVIGNWKMNPSGIEEARAIFRDIVSGYHSLNRVKVVICPPSPFLEKLCSLSKNKIALGAEDCFWGETGPYTGEVSAKILKSVGARYVILGHSERRALGDGDELINKKIKSALASGLKVIFCVGERSRDESGEYLNFIKNQLILGLDKIKKSSLENLSVAYEPIWAIGKDALRPASPEDVLETSIFIKKVLTGIFGYEAGIKVSIIYGGSVDEKNSREFLSGDKVDGLLIGRASLDPESFLKILEIASEV